MDLKIYRYFYEVAKTGSIRQAAENLYLSPSAISRYIKRLEDVHDATLFERSVKGMELTDIGRIIYQYVEVAINQQRMLENKISDYKNLDRGNISYSSIEGVLSSLILPTMTKFQAKYPKIAFSGTIESSYMVYKYVADGLIDIGIAFEEANRFDVEVIDYFYTDVVFITDNNHHDIPNNLSIQTLSQYPIATLNSKFYTRQLLNSLNHKHNANLMIQMESDQIDFIKRFIANKNYIGVLPEFSVSKEIKNGLFRKINCQDDSLEKIKTVVIQKKGRFHSNAMHVFISYLMNEIKAEVNPSIYHE